MSQVKLENWRPHILAAQQAKQSLAQYAREHGLSRHTLYVAHKLLKRSGEIPRAALPTRAARVVPPKKTRSAFVPVQMMTTASLPVTVRLPNGLALQFERVDAPLLALLASLPCLS